MKDITILPVLPSALIAEWDQVSEMLEKAMPVNLGRYWPVDILVMVIQGQAQAWLVREGDELLAVMITQINNYPRRRCFSIWCLSGIRMNDWFEAANVVLTDAARRMQCDHFETVGRPGWQKILDLDPKGVILVKDIPQMEAQM